MSSRDAIFASIRSHLGTARNETARLSNVKQRLRDKPKGTKPAFASLKDQERIDWFIRKSKDKSVEVHTVQSTGELVDKIRSICGDGDIGASEAVMRLGLPIGFSRYEAKSSSACCVSTCYCAIAETGSLVLTSDTDTSISQVFLADLHIVLMDPVQIEDSLEAVWDRLRNDAIMPRDVTLVSGPSSTGDIELQMEQGAHGPRELHVISIEGLI